ncbi:hypothetical protein PISMIDRAFT_677740 [Pisolithus microcarpus 441]|uniref:Unplaced genomic scaffold scaffold_28, whole genome shotgun sequence n=1 Tax=Pisolithus microcarpus 441 TaxID=765257 RepID=A0A0C9ZRT3_9AGAM|nr:hypothetical protein PISMIDRAFT_677740 [Pisolithus microcarpus 441]
MGYSSVFVLYPISYAFFLSHVLVLLDSCCTVLPNRPLRSTTGSVDKSRDNPDDKSTARAHSNGNHNVTSLRPAKLPKNG